RLHARRENRVVGVVAGRRLGGPTTYEHEPSFGGSICAFDRTDAVPDDFSVHLDLMSLWLARHINLSVFGRWPGPQVLHTAYERLHEHAENELCGCTSGRLYDRCCRQADL